ncbi:MAG: SDR family NAD(P)-dependent oxidoreductase [Candidatus Thiodiazotropha taylori]
MHTFKEKYGPWALVTGASSGIGAEFARQLAVKGLNVVLVARREERLAVLSGELGGQHEVETKVIVADLTTEDGLNTVIKETVKLEIGLLINNAGIEDSGCFLDTPLPKALTVMDLNCKAPLVLTHHVAAKMRQRKRGGILFMSSLVAFQGVPYIANYAASKAYDLIFAESLATEFQAYGIDVLSLNPGFTQTELSPDFDFKGLPIKPMAPEIVALTGLRALGKKRVAVPGAMNKFLYFNGKYLQPRKLNSFSFGRVFSHVLRNKLSRHKGDFR